MPEPQLSPKHSYRKAHPLDFRWKSFSDGDHLDPVLYIQDPPEAREQEVKIEITNRSNDFDISFGKNTQSYLALSFRPGTLHQYSISRGLSAQALAQQMNLATGQEHWEGSSELGPKPDRIFSIRLHWGGSQPYILSKGQSISLQLKGVSANMGLGTRGTRIELHYQGTFVGQAKQLIGRCTQAIEVVNHQASGPGPPPGTPSGLVAVEAVGSNAILNHSAENQPILCLKAKGDTPIQLSDETEIILLFPTYGETYDGRENKAAFGTVSEVQMVDIAEEAEIDGSTYTARDHFDIDPAEASEDNRTISIRLQSKSSQALPIYLPLTKLATSGPNGWVHLKVEVQNLSDQDDQSCYVALHKLTAGKAEEG